MISIIIDKIDPVNQLSLEFEYTEQKLVTKYQLNR